ncbi:MAG: hypothetical protein L7U83_01275 [Akkermansiaceae bacterium]|nr:hypothetical protein [Akkermansiaceae bacterium]
MRAANFAREWFVVINRDSCSTEPVDRNLASGRFDQSNTNINLIDDQDGKKAAVT